MLFRCYDGNAGKVLYFPTFVGTHRLALTNVNLKLAVPSFEELGYIQSPLERVLFADVTPANGELEINLRRSATTYKTSRGDRQRRLREAHRDGRRAAGGNILFLDAHVAWRRLENMTLRTTGNDGDLPAYWF